MLSAKKELFTPSDGGYQISRSVRLRSSASAYLNRTPASAGNRKTWTWSGWVKIGKAASTGLFTASTSGSNMYTIQLGVGGELSVYAYTGTYPYFRNTSAVFRDYSAWYHFVVAFDSTQATDTNRIKIYVNGVLQSTTSGSGSGWPTLNYDGGVNNTINHQFSDNVGGASYFDGYLTEINFIDGQALTPSSFGETNAITGVWQPKKYAGTYGTNGFYLNFSDNSTAAALGTDFSGNGNNWTPSAGISVTAGVTYDSMLDVPTPYADRGNYAVGNPLAVNVTTSATATLTNGNLLLTNGSATYSGFPSTMSIPVTGKWAWKFKVTGSVSGSNDGYIGFACNSSGNPVTGASSGAAANWFTTVQVQSVSDRGVVHKYAGGSVVTDAAGSGGTGATGDEWEFLIDRDAGTTIVKVNGTTKATVTGLPATQELFPFATFYQTSGYFIFDYTPSDTSYKTLNTQNLPDATIKKGNLYFNTATWSSDVVNPTAGQKSIALGFQPDLVWSKNRDNAESHYWMDSVRGDNAGNKWLRSNATAAEGADALGSTTASYVFNSTGFDIVDTNSASGEVYFNNGSASTPRTYVGWAWNAGGSTVTNTSGSISAQVRANPTAGFSVVTYTGTGANATVGHGLGVAPRMVITKPRNLATDWGVYHSGINDPSKALLLNSTAAAAAYGGATGMWNNTAPTSTVFSVGPNGSTGGAYNYVAYCFAPVAGYSAFGSYTGNGSADGPFVYCGFRPRWIMFKRTDVAEGWQILDTARNTVNVVNSVLEANQSNAESTSTARDTDYTANGFKVRNTSAAMNASSGTYIYAAFSEVGFKYALGR